jgi:hypothetical protein
MVWCGVRRLSMGLEYRMSHSLILIDALSSACLEKEKKKDRNSQGALVGHALLAVQHGIIAAVRYY